MKSVDSSLTPSWQWQQQFYQQLPELCKACEPQISPDPQVVFWNASLAEELSLEALPAEQLAQILSGNQLPSSLTPVAQAYAGHQFGQFNPQLGDGRAHLLGEVKNSQGDWQDVALKGSGRTPFSRGGDGRAALGPMLREVLLSESLHALGIPTTRSLAVVTTGAPVYRQETLQGAILTRTAASHLRIGTFQWVALQVYQGALPIQVLQRLTDFAIQRHYPSLADIDKPQERYVAFFEAVVEKQAHLIAQWMSVGFIHGVMNTDNMSIAGETIDFGPCAMLEHYDSEAVFSSIDHQGRYAHGNQPKIAQWNLARLAEALIPLLGDDESAAIERLMPALKNFIATYESIWLDLWCQKLGLDDIHVSDVKPLIDDFLSLLSSQSVDFTLACRRLSDVLMGKPDQWLALFKETELAEAWLTCWQALLFGPSSGECENASKAEQLRLRNPLVIARNHQVEAALDAAEEGDLSVFEALLRALQHPFDEIGGSEWSQPAERRFTDRYQTFCGT